MLQDKYIKLWKSLESLESVAIAFSGGVDSTFLIKVCHEVLGDKAIAVTATSSTYPQREFKEACDYAKQIGIKHIVIESEETEIDGFTKNPPNRCYYCKHELFSKVRDVADQYAIKHVIDGSNFDDLGDFRPGMEAARTLEVKSPLKDAEFTKEDIRRLSKKLNLPTWNKPAFACLSSRFPYGQEINREKLSMVEKAEDYLRNLNFKQLRVRHHGEIARIEVHPDERQRFFDMHLMDTISSQLKSYGFTYVTMDMTGYRTGSMNEVLNEDDKKIENYRIE